MLWNKMFCFPNNLFQTKNKREAKRQLYATESCLLQMFLA